MSKRFAVVLAVGTVGIAQGQLGAKEWFTPSAGQLTGAIVKALAERGIKVESGDVALLTTVVSTNPAPGLDVLSLAVVDGHAAGSDHPRSMVRVACHEAGECLPFYAVVNWADGAGVGGAASRSGSFQSSVKAAAPMVMRSGARATLLMEDGRAHVQISVVSLESGAAGKIVRVQTPDGKRTFTGEIVSASLLKGAF